MWSVAHGLGTNVLLNHVTQGAQGRLRFHVLRPDGKDEVPCPMDAPGEVEELGQEQEQEQLDDEIAAGIVAGLQLGCRAGPLCEEPLWCVCVVVESVHMCAAGDAGEGKRQAQARALSRVAGQVLSAYRDGLRFDLHHLQHEHGVATSVQVRPVEGMVSCQLQRHVESHSGDQLGRLYAVLSKRRVSCARRTCGRGPRS